jgi:flagellar biogenesis protein FliO
MPPALAAYVVPFAAPEGAVKLMVALVKAMAEALLIVGGNIWVVTRISVLGIEVPFAFVAVKLNA